MQGCGSVLRVNFKSVQECQAMWSVWECGVFAGVVGMGVLWSYLGAQCLSQRSSC